MHMSRFKSNSTYYRYKINVNSDLLHLLIRVGGQKLDGSSADLINTDLWRRKMG